MGIYLGSTDVNMFGGQPVQGGGGNPQTKSVTPIESAQSVYPDAGYYLSRVDVGAIDSEYVGSDVPRKSSSDLTASGATVSVPSGYYASNASKAVSSGSATPASSITGTTATVSSPSSNKIMLTQTVSNTPQVTAGYISSGTAGNSSVSLTGACTTKGSTTYYASTSDQTIGSGTYITGTQTFKAVSQTNLSAENIKNGTTISISNGNGNIWSVTGTYSGGSSKNVQIAQSTTRTNSSSLTAIGAELTVSKTGTYDIYYSVVRTTTSSSYTWASRLYYNGSGYGSGEVSTGWTNNVQNTHLANISLTVNDKLRVYGRHTRGSSYYITSPVIMIVEV